VNDSVISEVTIVTFRRTFQVFYIRFSVKIGIFLND